MLQRGILICGRLRMEETDAQLDPVGWMMGLSLNDDVGDRERRGARGDP